MRRPAPGQLSLFGAQYVHIGHRGPVTGLLECVLCRVSLLVAAALDCCDDCIGIVEPAPPWALLAAVEEPAELEEAA